MASSDHEKPAHVAKTEGFFEHLGISEKIPETSETKDFYTQLIGGIFQVNRVDRGRVVCSLSVNAAIIGIFVHNPYNMLHGGLVAAVAEVVGSACAKSVAGDKGFFLGELSTAYLSAAKLNDVVEVDGHVLWQGRSVVVTSIEFKIKKTQKLF